MKNKIDVVGLGPGNINYLTQKGIESIKSCEIIISGARQLLDIEKLLIPDTQKYTLKKLLDVIDFINNNRDKKICVVVSGDTGFYSLVPFLEKYFKKDELNIIPGISSFQYLFSKIGDVWQNYAISSVHGRENDYINMLKNHLGIALLTDNKNTPYMIAKNIYDNGFKGYEIIIGEQLSYEDEKITYCDIENYEKLNRNFEMNVVIVRRKNAYL